MAHILVVDDVQDYCEEIAAGLVRDGHKVMTATDGAEAIRLGSIFRPDVLVTDWMLKDHVSGLDVFKSITLVMPYVRTVLISGFASMDLRADARMARVYDFLEKPFSVAELRQTVAKAASTRPPPSHLLPVGFLAVDPQGGIEFANDAAYLLFEKTEAGRSAADLRALFGPDQAARIQGMTSEWLEVAPKSVQPMTWHICRQSSENGESPNFVILDEPHLEYRNSPVLNRLLGRSDGSDSVFQIDGHVLVVDALESLRRTIFDVVHHFNGVCHTAGTHTEALRLFVSDPEIRHVVIDYEMPDGSAESLVHALKETGRDIHLVGSSAKDAADTFRALGVTDFIRKPWTIHRLLTLLCGTRE